MNSFGKHLRSLALTSAIMAAMSASPALAAPEPPNIIYILADDMGFGDVSAYNPASKIKTPNLDALAKDGMRFTDAHSPSGVCTPTRYATMTGRYSWRSRLKSGVLWGYSPTLIEKGRATVGNVLKAKGYKTAFVGKWHLGLGWTKEDPGQPATPSTGTPTRASINVDFTQKVTGTPSDYGFDYSHIIPASLDMSPYCFIENGMVPSPKMVWGTNGAWRDGYASEDFRHVEVLDTFTVKARKWIRNHVAASPRQPFLMYMALPSPHAPIVPDPRFKGTSQAGDYGDFMVQTDWVIGQILAAVDSAGAKDNTLIIVTSDNGPETYMVARKTEYNHYSAGPYRGMKRDLWEGGHRVPYIARWPGKVKAGSVSREIICQVDLIATVAALAGYALPDSVGEDSYSLLPLLLDKQVSTPVREATIHHSSEGGFAIRKGVWKFIDGRGSMGSREEVAYVGPEGQLYDLGKDSTELNSANQYSTQPAKVQELDALLQKYKTEGRSTPLVRKDAFLSELIPTASLADSRKDGIRWTSRQLSLKSAHVLEVFDLSGKLLHRSRSEAGHTYDFARKGEGAVRLIRVETQGGVYRGMATGF